MQATEKIWRNGSFVSWEDANVHILTHALHYGTGVFEGIRAYDTPKGSAVFRLTDHLSGCAARPRSTRWTWATATRSWRPPCTTRSR